MTRQHDVGSWMKAFAACVRERAYERGRALFADDVSSFGTVARRARGLSVLEEGQWRQVWPRTEGFDFDEASMEVIESDDGSLIAVLAAWESRGKDDDGRTFPRRGRATLLLAFRPDAPFGYEAVHSHFSFVPEASRAE